MPADKRSEARATVKAAREEAKATKAVYDAAKDKCSPFGEG